MRVFIFLVLITLSLFTSGCLDEIGKGFDDFATAIFRADPKVEATFAEIDAVGKLKSDEAMEDGFWTIAKRIDLSSRSQVRLTETSLNKLQAENAKVKVLLEIINNGNFSYDAKKNILQNLKKLESKDNREMIVGTINNRVIGVKTDIPPSEGKIQAVLSTSK